MSGDQVGGASSNPLALSVVRPQAPLTFRSKVGVLAGKSAAHLSRLLGKGAGGMFGGKVALRLSPTVLQELAHDKRVVLVTGTNGKSTTTRMTTEAIRTVGKVATNSNGDNMPTGIVTALMTHRDAPFAVLEVDEMHMPEVAAATNPSAIILLNLSRDQLDRVGEIGAVEQRIREAVQLAPDALIVANCDDPLICSAAWDAKEIAWVSAGAPWKADSTTFPRTGTLVFRDEDGWSVEGDGSFSRPVPQWSVGSADDDGQFTIHGPGVQIRTKLQVPGRANRGNAAQAAACATHFGARSASIAEALASVSAVAGRYQTYDVEGREARLILAKNPAGWQESLSMIERGTRQLVIAVNGQIPDGVDMSWLWDVDFDQLGTFGIDRIFVSGQRGADLAVRLEYANVPFEFVEDPLEAIRLCEPGPVEVLANYTAFRDLKWELERL